MDIVNFDFACCDVKEYIKSLPDSYVDCIICDPPFGLDEDNFDKHYARDSDKVLDGYVTAPKDNKKYEEWSKSWISLIPRILKKTGTFYVVCAWNHLVDIELAIRETSLKVLNHIIWKYNFGVYTQKKFVTSHYHILRCGYDKPNFYSRAFYDETQKTKSGGSLQYLDMEDVWEIPKEYSKGETKNINKLPDALVKKMILYATQPNDIVADFFMGNFTTAYVSKKCGRKVIGCDINDVVCNFHIPKVNETKIEKIEKEKESTKPKNAGKKITEEERNKIKERYEQLSKTKNKKESVSILQEEFLRGKFSILNILKK